MPMPKKTRTSEWLKSVGAINISERIIKASEYIDVICNCGETGSSTAGNLDSALKNKNNSWLCKNCKNKEIGKKTSSRIGSKNPFYGKKHTQKTKDLLSKNKIEYLSTVDSSEKMSRMRRIAHEKFNGNPMFNLDVKSKHYEKTHTKEFIENATAFGIKQSAKPGFSQKMGNYSNEYWNSSSGSEQKQTLRQKMIEEYNTITGKFFQKRKDALKVVHSNPSRMQQMVDKLKESYRKATGYDNPMQNPVVRTKVLGEKGMKKGEKFIFEFLTNRGFPFVFNANVNDKNWDFVIYEGNIPILIIEIDGEFCHGLTCDPYVSIVGGHKDGERFSKIPDGCKYLQIDSRKCKKAPAEILKMLDIDYDLWINDLYDLFTSQSFPFPFYEDKRMLKDWKHLKNMPLNEKKHSLLNMQCNSIITHFHKSIYFSKRKGHISPVEAWNNPKKLKECIENRIVYGHTLSSQQIARGFERSNIAPRVTVFQPTLVRYLLQKFAINAKTMVDPFSGFSGRALGACSLDMAYTGYDINPIVIEESNNIKNFLNMQNCTFNLINSTDIIDDNEYDVLLTCPPYGNKEIWMDGQDYQNEDFYITESLKRFKAGVYIFIVGKTELYKDNIVMEIDRKSHMTDSKERVILIKK